jgi:hypothetical protein
MSVKLLKELTVSGKISKFNNLPALAEVLSIMAGVLITTTSIIGVGMLINTISAPSLAQVSHQPLQTERVSTFTD